MSSNNTKDRGYSQKWCIQRLFDHVDGASLAIFRILWGMVMCYEIYTYYSRNYSKVRFLFLSSDFRVKYWGFEFLQPWETLVGWKWHLALLGALSISMTVGFFHRICHFAFLLGFGYIYLLDQSYYLNHFYLVTIIQTILVIVPASSCWSIDDLLFGKESIKREKVPRWAVLLFQLVIVIVYTYAGVAKLNYDWLRGEPLRHWLGKRAFYPLIGPLLSAPFATYFFSYGGLIFDLFIGGLLMIPGRMVWVASGLCYFFHATNKLIFNIGIFPWMCLAATTVFWSPSWPRESFSEGWAFLDAEPTHFLPRPERREKKRNTHRSKEGGDDRGRGRNSGEEEESDARGRKRGDKGRSEGGGDEYNKKGLTRRKGKTRKIVSVSTMEDKEKSGGRRVVVHRHNSGKGVVRYTGPITTGMVLWTVFLVIFLSVQVLVPLRHLTYPGDVAWNEFGHKFSWRMKLRDKQCNMAITAVRHHEDHTTSNHTIHLRDYVNPKQARKMKSRPQSLVQFAHHVANNLEGKDTSNEQISVYADVNCSLNYRHYSRLINPTVDLAQQPWWDEPYSWVLPAPSLTEEDLEGLPWRWNWDGWWPILPSPPGVLESLRQIG